MLALMCPKPGWMWGASQRRSLGALDLGDDLGASKLGSPLVVLEATGGGAGGRGRRDGLFCWSPEGDLDADPGPLPGWSVTLGPCRGGEPGAVGRSAPPDRRDAGGGERSRQGGGGWGRARAHQVAGRSKRPKGSPGSERAPVAEKDDLLKSALEWDPLWAPPSWPTCESSKQIAGGGHRDSGPAGQAHDLGRTGEWTALAALAAGRR